MVGVVILAPLAHLRLLGQAGVRVRVGAGLKLLDETEASDDL